ncbi:MAG: hypothetical protein RUMPE_00606 [Eubacteriales bacterium SKADARSKE-1]|nr:hypothetical protein [Eubacteriales bacterium SKADARSKE-1]
MEFKLANINMEKDLKELCRISFFMQQEEVNFLFANKIHIDNCAVCLVGGQVVSALYMFDTYILKNGQVVPIYYLYGASTFPEFRNRGYMSSLINFANEVAQKKGQLYSVLLPATDKLHIFYKKLGYENFFKTRFVRLNWEELKNFFHSGESFNKKLSFEQMSEIRKRIYCRDGDVFRDSNAIRFAVKQNDFCGGKTIFSKNGYAICKLQEDNVLVSEFAVDEIDFKNLIFNIYKEFGNIKYIFRLADDEMYFKGLGKSIPFGVIKGLGENFSKHHFNCSRAPYLGLTLD